MKKNIKLKFLFYTLSSFLILGSTSGLLAQEMPNDPKEILKVWDYYQLKQKLGKGEPIIDSMAGQAYVAGMKYAETWFNRKVNTSYLFTEVDISSVKMRFWSHLLEERGFEKSPKEHTPEQVDSLLRVFQVQDSLRQDSVNRLLRVKPDLMDELEAESMRINAEAKVWYDLDSLRCDSLIHDISQYWGQPRRQDTTKTHEEGRYYAIWLEDGVAISLSDHSFYTDIVFSIPLINDRYVKAFDLSPKMEVNHLRQVKTEQDLLEINYVLTPVEKEVDVYNQMGLIVRTQDRVDYAELYLNAPWITQTKIEFIDVTADGIPEIWMQCLSGQNAENLSNFLQIITLENSEPYSLFETQLEITDGIQGRLMHGFQAELEFADGTSFMFPIDKTLPALKNHYNSNGVLQGNDALISGPIDSIELIDLPDKKNVLSAKIQIVLNESMHKIGEVNLQWRYSEGYWEIINYFIENPVD